MKRKTGSVSKMLALSGLVALVVSTATVASSDDEVLERIRPIGKVSVAQPAASAAPIPAPAAAPAATAAPAVAPAAPAAPAPVLAPATEAPAAAALPAAAPAGGGETAGKKTYDTVCFVCHMAGVSNAPKLGDKAAWEPRIAKGMDALMQSSINGIPGTAMPPRGTCAACSDDDLKAAVEYMVSQAQ